MKEVRSPSSEQITQARREASMDTARLEHAILQTVINHVAEHHLTREQIIMALINVTGYWQKKIILVALTKKLQEEKNGR